MCMQICLLAGAVCAVALAMHGNLDESSVGRRLSKHGLPGT